LTSLDSQARYITRPALAMDTLQKFEDGRLALETPPDPRTGATLLALDPLEWIHRILCHGESERCKAKDPFEPRAPPGAHSRFWQ
jgi:hypothetical protein